MLDNAPLLDNENVEAHAQENAVGDVQDEFSHNDLHAVPNVRTEPSQESDVIRSIYNPIPVPPASSQNFTGAHPKELSHTEAEATAKKKKNASWEKNKSNDNFDQKRQAVQQLNPGPLEEESLHSGSPYPPYSSYFQGSPQSVENEFNRVFVDRTLLKGVTDTPPMIRKAKQMIAKYQSRIPTFGKKDPDNDTM